MRISRTIGSLLIALSCCSSWVQAKAFELVSADQDWYPIYYMDDQGQFAGIWADLLHELFEKRLQIELEVSQKPWLRAQLEVESGSADGMITVITDARLAYAHAIEPRLFSLEFHLFAPSSHAELDLIKQVSSIDQLKQLDLVIASTRGNGWHQQNIEAAGIRSHYVGSDEQLVQFVAFERADAFIDAPLTILPLIKSLQLNPKLVYTDSVFSEIHFNLMMSHSSEFVDQISAFSDALQAMKADGTYERIINKWLNQGE